MDGRDAAADAAASKDSDASPAEGCVCIIGIEAQINVMIGILCA